MGLGAAGTIFGKDAKALPSASTELATYGTAHGVEHAAGAWATGPAKTAPIRADDLDVARGFKAGLNDGVLISFDPVFRFPVLVSWDFTCTGDGGFERLMNELDVGLLGTVDETTTTPLEVAATGHLALAHHTRQGEGNTAWYRGPLTPQPTVRTTAVNGVLPLANTGDQLRKVVPDGREDLSQAALFEIGRLLTLNKPALVGQLMAWRADLFGAARAREIANALTGSILANIGVVAAGRRDAIENLVRTQLVGTLTALAPDALAPPAPLVTQPRRPNAISDIAPERVLLGLGANPKIVATTGKAFGVDGLTAVPVPVGQASTAPIGQDQAALAALTTHLTQRVDDLVASALKIDAQPKDARRRDELDRMITDARRRNARRR
jgi:hypothetical protein